MKSSVLLVVLLCLSSLAMAQNNGQKIPEQVDEQHYLYQIIYVSGNIKNEGLKVDIDDGRAIERVKDADGKVIKFKTPAAVLMYFYNEGWELTANGVTTSGSSYGIASTTYWLFRKPCTKEEFETAVKEGRRK